MTGVALRNKDMIFVGEDNFVLGVRWLRAKWWKNHLQDWIFFAYSQRQSVGRETFGHASVVRKFKRLWSLSEVLVHILFYGGWNIVLWGGRQTEDCFIAATKFPLGQGWKMNHSLYWQVDSIHFNGVAPPLCRVEDNWQLCGEQALPLAAVACPRAHQHSPHPPLLFHIFHNSSKTAKIGQPNARCFKSQSWCW